MPWVYIYTPEMFMSALPNENSSGNFSGSMPYTLTLRPDAVPLLVEIIDTDANPTHFGEVTTGQSIGQPVTSGGVTYPAGRTLQGAYNLSNVASHPGLTVATFRFGTDGYDAGPVQGLVSTQALSPGQGYTFRSTATTNGNEIPYASLYTGTPPCFVRGTRIDTPEGPVAVERLSVGDRIVTRDRGVQTLRWIGSRRLNGADLRADPRFRPVRIGVGALGDNVPSTELTVSPQHRMLVRSIIARRMFGVEEVLVAARHLAELPGIEVILPDAGVEYFHLMFDRHEIVRANGADAESLYCGPGALGAVGAAARAEILELFPELARPDGVPEPARPIAPGRRARTLAARHGRNGHPLVRAAAADPL